MRVLELRGKVRGGLEEQNLNLKIIIGEKKPVEPREGGEGALESKVNGIGPSITEGGRVFFYKSEIFYFRRKKRAINRGGGDRGVSRFVAFSLSKVRVGETREADEARKGGGDVILNWGGWKSFGG